MSVLTDHLRALLPDVGEGLGNQFIDLARDATEERCERLLINLRGAQHTVMRLREALQREDGANGP